jgi:hypothetical protein
MDNNSAYYKDWTTEKLKDEYRQYYSMVYEIECYGVRDMMTLMGIEAELFSRGIEPKTSVHF